MTVLHLYIKFSFIYICFFLTMKLSYNVLLE
nr:MAG TPA: hypothetical protein [Caudoviricetes sp.]